MKGSKDTDAAKQQIKDDVEKAISSAGEAVAEVSAAEFTQSQRERLAKKGHALKDGSFPIRNKSDLKNAIKTWGLAKKSNKAKAKKFIKLRAKQLDAMDEIPKNW
jgi:protein-disulfide isomerase-like protein with CxxC motif